MAALTDEDRAALWAQTMADMSNGHEPAPGLKAEVRAAVNAADDWASSNAAAFNTALPQPFRGNATAAQKARLLTRIMEKRWLVGA